MTKLLLTLFIKVETIERGIILENFLLINSKYVSVFRVKMKVRWVNFPTFSFIIIQIEITLNENNFTYSVSMRTNYSKVNAKLYLYDI